MAALEPWPLEKFRAALARAAREGAGPKGVAVALTTGGLNPAHLGHVQLLHQARKRLEKEGYKVVGLWLSPSHDDYLQPKARNLKTIGLSAGFRLEVSERAVAEDPLVSIGYWEATQPGSWPDFPEVTAALQAHLAALPEATQLKSQGSGQVQVFYACGTDHADKCRLYAGMRMPGIGVVVVPRLGEAVGRENPAKMVYVAEPSEGAVASFSSTKVRAAIASSAFSQVAEAMSPHAATFLLQPKAEEHSRFPDDFALLGVTPPADQEEAAFPGDIAMPDAAPPAPRRMYISLSSLMRQWDARGAKLLEELPSDALFFFGSKRSWVFPVGPKEQQESVQENSRYTDSKYQGLRDLILEKESRREVFFLKPPGFKYNGGLYHGDPGAFPRASEWLQSHTDPLTGKPFAPLFLDPEWWKSSFKNAKYTRHVPTIVKNFQNGAHDYQPIMELLHQSNPTLEIVM